MNKIKSFFRGVYREGRRIRWMKGEPLTQLFTTVLAYAVVVGLILVLFDYLVIEILNWVHFS